VNLDGWIQVGEGGVSAKRGFILPIPDLGDVNPKLIIAQAKQEMREVIHMLE